MPVQANERDQILEAMQALPAEATIEDAMDRLYALAKVRRGVEQLDAGHRVPHDQGKQQFGL